MLIAGFKAPATSWHYQLKPLARAGYRGDRVLDRRGHGRSGIGGGRRTPMDRTAPTSTTCSRRFELDDVTLVGQSMGGNAIWALGAVVRLAGYPGTSLSSTRRRRC